MFRFCQIYDYYFYYYNYLLFSDCNFVAGAKCELVIVLRSPREESQRRAEDSEGSGRRDFLCYIAEKGKLSYKLV